MPKRLELHKKKIMASGSLDELELQRDGALRSGREETDGHYSIIEPPLIPTMQMRHLTDSVYMTGTDTG